MYYISIGNGVLTFGQKKELIIRNEKPEDNSAVEFLTREAFWNVYCPGACEHYLLHVMRDNQAFVEELDFVAELEGKVIGNVVFVVSHIDMDNGEFLRTLTMGPIAVSPEYQRHGVGRCLVTHALAKAIELDYAAVLLCGEPDLYGKYGFEPAEKYGIRNADNNYSPALHIYWLKTDMTQSGGRYYENGVYEIDNKNVEAYDKLFPYKEKVGGTPSQRRFEEIAAMSRPFEQKL